MSALSVIGLRKAFGGTPVLRGVDLDVPAGGFVTVLGASGGGKTTLLRLLCGFERADAGEIALGGRRVAGLRLHERPERRRIGYVAQEGALFPHLTAAENVLFGLPRTARRDRRRAEALLERVGLDAAHAARAPHQLSGGEQQRVALARALAPEPALVLLDEPFSALDAALRAETRQAVQDALAASGATALLVTHDQDEALSMSQRVAVLRDGVVVQYAAPETLYRQPADAALASFVGEAILLDAQARNGMALCGLGTVRLAQGAPTGHITLLLRPEQLVLGATDASAATARVETVQFYGHDARVTLRLPDGQEAQARLPGHRAPPPGQPVTLQVDGDAWAFPAR